MNRLEGYGGAFGLRCRRADGGVSLRERASDDVAALRLEARRLIADGAFDLIELSAWSFELNDWVRLETFGARTPRAEG